MVDGDSQNDDQHVIKKKRTLSEFKIGRVLGEGSYSTVVFAREKATGRDIALKILSKNHIIKEKKIHIVAREKHILTLLRHPFFVKLFFTFQDKDSLYYGLSLAKGGELLTYLKKLKKFSDETTKFYASEILCAVNYMHSVNIIHRDIKPENVLLSDKLHVLITDFASTDNKETLDDDDDDELKKDRTESFAGTAQYVSPEMLKTSTTTKCSDIWAVGCVIYQMTTGLFPFNGGNEYQIFQKINRLEYSIPSYVSDKLANLISSILVLDPKIRLGSDEIGGFDSIKNHPYFKDVPWDNLINLKAPDEMFDVYSEFQKIPQDDDFSEDELFKRAATNSSIMFSDADQNLKDESATIKTENLQHSSNPNQVPVTEKINLVSEGNNILYEFPLIKDNIGTWMLYTEGNKIVKYGYLFKKKGLFPRKRMFLITEGPKIYYIDPLSMELKGTIPWSRELRCSKKNENFWNIHILGRTYNLEDRSGNSQEWIDEIIALHKKYFDDG